MLQQTTVNTVLPYYRNWTNRFPRLKNVADASIQEILRFWQGLGYYNRAKNIHQTAKAIVKDYGGIFPHEANILKKLPGFGPYTTGAVLSFAFKKPYTIVDANVRRVMMRQLGIKGNPDSSHDKNIYRYLNQIIPNRSADIFNQALMELGALVCRSANPQCHLCPVKASCQAYKSGVQRTILESRRHKIEIVHAVVAVILHHQKYLIQKRPPSGLLADLWEFPGGKICKGESSLEALKREIKEELHAQITKAKFFTHIHHAYTRYRVRLDVWICDLDIYPRSHKDRKWIKLADFHKFPMPAGSVKIVKELSAN